MTKRIAQTDADAGAAANGSTAFLVPSESQREMGARLNRALNEVRITESERFVADAPDIGTDPKTAALMARKEVLQGKPSESA